MSRGTVTILSVLGMTIVLSGCGDNDATVVSRNISQAADNLEVNRRIVFYNGITGDYMLTIEGLCSQEPSPGKLAVICKVGSGKFKKHFLGLSDNVTYFSEQVEFTAANAYHYRVTFKPSVIIPYVDIRN